VSDDQDVQLLGVQLAQHDLQLLHRRPVMSRNSNRSKCKLVLGEELSDCSLGRKQLDAHENLVPRRAVAEYLQRQVVLYVRRSKSFQSVGGAAQLDEAREAVLTVRVAAFAQQYEDIGVVAEALLIRETATVTAKVLAAHNSDEPLWIATDQELDELDVVGALDRRPQRGLELVGVGAASVSVRSGECEREGRRW